ncbi:MAG: dihydroorotate dehydrogenase, partial [Clostridia bacterium]|nr:dihydroorotate dehydrogenase [Clostridia bacterium]
LGGHSEEDYLIGAKKLNEADIDILELNISCPNVKTGGMAFGTNPKVAENLVSKVKNITRFPLLVKLTPNTADITEIARACENGGADGVSLVNTFLGMAIDIKVKKPVFNNVYAGLSGPAIMPVALRMVHQTAKSVKIPVVGMGGITTWKDTLCFMMAGAKAVQVGTANFIRPTAVLDIIDGLEKYCVENNLANISEIVGII